MVRLGACAAKWILKHASDQLSTRMFRPSRDLPPRQSNAPFVYKNVPATAFSSVDFPEPLVPDDNDPRSGSQFEVDAAQRVHFIRRSPG